MYNVTNLTPNTNYTFDIVASNDTGVSNKSTVNVRTFIPSTSNSNNNYTPEPLNPRNVSLENVIFVDQSSTYGSNNGTTWNNAYTNLQDALARTDLNGKQIWIAKGTYYPSTSFTVAIPIGGRNVSFVIPAGLKVYGVFFGAELSLASRTAGNTVTLSGDINKNDNENDTSTYNDNSYHVVMIQDINKPSTINSLTITSGTSTRSGGGGLYVDNSSPIINNVIFSKNRSPISSGGAIYATGTTELTITSSTFNNNTSVSGGAIAADLNNLNIISSSFTNNISTENDPESGGGAAICAYSGNLNVKSSRFQNNKARQCRQIPDKLKYNSWRNKQWNDMN